MTLSAKVLVSTALIVAAVAGGYGLYRFGMSRGMTMSGATDAGSQTSYAQGEDATRRHISAGLKAGDVDPVSGQKILYYHDPMVPGKRFDAPGKSPFMDMMLVPVYSGGDAADTSQVTVSPRIQQTLGLRTAEVVEGTLEQRVTAIGTIVWNERDQVRVQARTNGFIERVYPRATLDRVERGQLLAEIYSPDWVAAQEEFLAVRGMQGEGLAPLVDAARARMRQTGMDEASIARLDVSGSLQTRAEIRAPIEGVLTEVNVREGMTVAAGSTLFRINGTTSVWAEGEVPESQIALLRPGSKVQATSPATHGEVFEGRVQALLPEVNQTTRTRKARVEIANRGMQLVPGMLMQMQFVDPRAARTLLVPSEAVIQTGQRAIVMLAEDGGKFRPVPVEIGAESNGRTEIKRGLSAGQRVVASAQFLIDSEASLRGVEARLSAPDVAAPGQAHGTQGTVEAIDQDTITLTHPKIDALKWPPMTMDFKLPPADKRPPKLAPGEQVEFEFKVLGNDIPQILTIRRRPQATPSTPGSKP